MAHNNYNNDYTFGEMTDMHLCFGLASGNANEARRLYQERFPNRHLPCAKTFSRIDDRLRETGTFKKNSSNSGRQNYVRTPALEEAILDRVAETPSTSTRKIANGK